MVDSQPILRMENISKSFGNTLANDSISLEIFRGEIHALLGENGAGKSTLMNTLYGLYKPDSGKIFIDDKEVHITSPRAAVNEGIGMVHQHFMLVENMTALENVMLGISHEKAPLLDIDGIRNKFKNLADKYGLMVDPDTPVWQLSVGEQQWLEIIKLLFRDVNILILDEPTAVLTPSEAQQLFVILERLISEDKAIIFITHKLDEVKQVAHKTTVLRDGKLVGTLERDEITQQKLSTMMVGRPVTLERKSRPISNRDEKEEAVVIKNLNCDNDRGMPALKDINLVLHAGEILGIAGVDGNGQRELAECIIGLRKPTSGHISILGNRVTEVEDDPSLVGYIPEDRQKTGLVMDFKISENLILKTYEVSPFDKHGVTQWDEVTRNADDLIVSYGIKASGPLAPVKTLSGGNQQKVVVARETNKKPAVIIASQPTRGLDLGAIESLHELLLNERNRGAAVLFISTELSEILALSDWIAVLFNGEVVGEQDGDTADVIKIGEMMMGQKATQVNP